MSRSVGRSGEAERLRRCHLGVGLALTGILAAGCSDTEPPETDTPPPADEAVAETGPVTEAPPTPATLTDARARVQVHGLEQYAVLVSSPNAWPDGLIRGELRWSAEDRCVELVRESFPLTLIWPPETTFGDKQVLVGGDDLVLASGDQLHATGAILERQEVARMFGQDPPCAGSYAALKPGSIESP